MKKILQKIIGQLLKTVSDVLPFAFDQRISARAKAIAGSYVRPVNYDELPAQIQRKLDEGYTIEEKKVYVLRNVLATPGGLVFKNLKIFLPSVINEYVKSLLSHTFLLRQFLPGSSIIKFKEPVIIAHDEWSQNYYHWLVDLLPRLLLLNNAERAYTLLLPPYETEYMAATVAAMGIEHVHKIASDAFVEASTLVFPERTAIGTYQNPELLREVQKRLVESLKLSDSKPFRRVYVSRADSGKRRLLNEQKVFLMLEKLGFECVFFEKLTFVQQAELLWQTEVLVGVHGANFTNILFMQKGAKVIELMNHDCLNLVYYRMASALALPYFLVPCLAAGSSKYGDEYFSKKNDLDVEVLPATLEQVLGNIFPSNCELGASNRTPETTPIPPVVCCLLPLGCILVPLLL